MDAPRNRSNGSRTLMGEAPRLMLFLLPGLALATVARLAAPGIGSFTLRFRGLFVIAAILLAGFGLLFWISAAIGLLRAWRGRTLATRGAYGLCRHPIFAVWIWSVIPAVAFLTDSWYFLVADILFLAGALIVSPAEERALEEEFGDAYSSYRRRVRKLVPIARIRPITLRRCLRGLGFAALSAAGAVALVAFVAVPASSRLGATPREARMAIPGDDRAPAPRIKYTQAITINAPPERVWPWLVQIGYHRAGWYNIDAINLLAGSDYFIDGGGSSTRIHPELQDLAVGDSIALVPVLAFEIFELSPNEYFVMGKGPAPGVDRNAPGFMNVVWTFALEPIGNGATRLITRYRTELAGGFAANFLSYVFNDLGGALLQQPAMLYGVKVRAEQSL